MALTVPGMSSAEVNKWAAVLIVCYVAVICIDILLERIPALEKFRVANRIQKPWVIGMLIFSYSLLVPAMFWNLFNMLIGALDSVEFYTSSESMMELIVMLWQDDVFVGAILLIIFAILIPVVKLWLIVTAEFMKWKRPQLAGRCIHFVQMVSKWACPDMFAYILFSHLIWDMDHPPTLTGRFQLDLGFTCYAMFCLGSTVSSLGLETPKIESKVSEPMPKWAFVLLCFMAAVFSASLAMGLALPVMAMRLDIGILVEVGEIPADYVPFIEELHIAEMASTDVTILACIADMADISEGFDLNSWIAVLLLAVFVIALPIFDMIALCIAALQSTRGTRSCAFAVSGKLNKLAMLDVASLGIVVVVFSGSIYKKKGLVMTFCPGLVGLILASLCNFGAYLLVKTYAPATALEEDCKLAKKKLTKPARQLQSQQGTRKSLSAHEAIPDSTGQCRIHDP